MKLITHGRENVLGNWFIATSEYDGVRTDKVLLRAMLGKGELNPEDDT